MKYYKSPTNEIFAYEVDGSQDNYIKKDFVAITEKEAQAIIDARPPLPSLFQLLSKEEQIANLEAQLAALKESA
jgi:uncharacterized protein YdeI (YjbR/CyaY-like superfamily)